MPEQSELNPLEEMNQLYRNVFASLEGQKVLGDILTQGRFGLTLDGENKDQIARYNFALTVANKAGVFDEVYRKLEIIETYQKFGLICKGE